MDAWNWRDVEVLASDGPPEVRLSGAAAQRASALGVEVQVSLTHTRRQAAAVAITRPATVSRAPS
jgi:holo-[acyl-carrier protein] synthase